MIDFLKPDVLPDATADISCEISLVLA